MDAAQKVRTQCMRNFTRSVTSYNDAHDRELPLDLLTKAFEKVQTCFEKLEAAQDAYVVVADEDDGGVDYLEEPAARHQQVLITYGEFKKKSVNDERTFQQKLVEDNQKADDIRKAKEVDDARVAELAKVQAERDELYETKCAEYGIAVDAFSRMNGSIQGVVAEASDADKRLALGKLENDFQELRNKLVALGSIDSTKDTKVHQDSFVANVEKPFAVTQKWFLSQLKDTPSLISPSSSLSGKNVVSGSSLASNTKKEAVTLPSFKGDLSSSPSPYLTYPVWRKRWDTLIGEYDRKWHINFLLDRLDDAARNQFVGYEEDYEGAMERLDSYYGDPLKVVSCVMTEVNAPAVICEGDYQALISYSSILENNFNRLKSMDLDHEMSNTSSMSMILRKFPNPVSEKWAEHIVTQGKETKSKPFPEFISWLISQKQIWERVAAVEATRGDVVVSSSHFAGVGNGKEKDLSSLKCFKCGEMGHRRRDCTKSNSKVDQKKPKRPKFKLHWCAFHKDDPSKHCSSVSCQDLRKADVTTRVQLLKINKDCLNCLGDHDQANCSREPRICGGGKADRGCTTKHVGHEMFCVAAKVFAIQHVHSQQGNGEAVVLLITRVRVSCRMKNASVFWDLGSTSNFVRDAFAKEMKFRGRQERLCVTTLTGTVTDYAVTTYRCHMHDENNELYEFEAYGLECITGALSTIDGRVIKQLFPNLSDKFVRSLLRGTTVDFLIGMKHPSWHPEHAERSNYGGNIWLY